MCYWRKGFDVRYDKVGTRIISFNVRWLKIKIREDEQKKLALKCGSENFFIICKLFLNIFMILSSSEDANNKEQALVKDL